MKSQGVVTLSIGTALLLGISTPFVGAFVSQFSNVSPTRLFMLVGVLIVASTLVVTGKDFRRHIFLFLILILPYSAWVVPSGKLEVSIFDVAMLTMAILTLKPYRVESPAEPIAIFPYKVFILAFLLVLPSVIFSHFVIHSTRVLVENFCLYLFFIYTCVEVRRAGGMLRIAKLVFLATILLSLGIFLELAGVNVGYQAKNLNTMGVDQRASGFFQDPQKAAQFLACASSFIFVLVLRNYCSGEPLAKLMAWTALLLGSFALLATGSRSSFISAITLSSIALLLLNRWPWILKGLLIVGVITLIIFLGEHQEEIANAVLPPSLASRLLNSNSDLSGRMVIWFDTWDMFELNPIQGIGLGSFYDYLKETRPWTRNFYGIAGNTGAEYIPDQPENGYLKILYESGLLGSVAAVMIVLVTIFKAFNAMRFNNDKIRSEMAAALVGLFVFSGSFLTLFTLADPRNAIIMLLMFGIIWGRSTIASSNATNPPSPAILVAS